MRRFVLLYAGIIVLAHAGVVSAQDGGLSFDSVFTDSPPTIDGVIEAGEWDGATAIEVDAVDQEPPGVVSEDSGPKDPPGIQSRDDFNATVFVMNDVDHIYVGVDVNDDILDMNTFDDLWRNDSVEIRIDGNFSRLEEKEDDVFGYSANIRSDGGATENFPEGAEGTASAKADGSGWMAEFAGPIVEGFVETIGFEVAINDSDDPSSEARDAQIRINSLSDSAWNDESQWARLTLIGTQQASYEYWELMQ